MIFENCGVSIATFYYCLYFIEKTFRRPNLKPNLLVLKLNNAARPIILARNQIKKYFTRSLNSFRPTSNICRPYKMGPIGTKWNNNGND